MRYRPVSHLSHPTPSVPDSIVSSHSLRIVHAVFSSRLAGSERYCIDLANRQSELGHEVHVIGAAHSPVRAALMPGVRFHGLGRFLRGWRARRLVARLAPEVCHAHLSAACKAFGSLRTPAITVGTLHVGYKPHQHSRLDGLICVNRAQASRLGDYRGEVQTIPNWLPAMPAPASRLDLRRQLGLPAHAFVIGAVGRLHRSKGVDVLVDAFQRSAPANAALVLLGDGPLRPELERWRRDDRRLHLLGHRDDIGTYLQEFDLFVSPSREESFGLAIVEAMSHGLPVIATETEGPREYLRDQPLPLVPPGDVAALAAAIGDAAAAFRAGQLARQRYDLRRFDATLRVAEVLSFYRHVQARTMRRALGWTAAPVNA